MPSQYIQQDGTRYERDLFEHAQQLSTKLGKRPFGKEHAEQLWKMAMDGNKVTATEARTLEYIVANYPMHADASSHLKKNITISRKRTTSEGQVDGLRAKMAKIQDYSETQAVEKQKRELRSRVEEANRQVSALRDEHHQNLSEANARKWQVAGLKALNQVAKVDLEKENDKLLEEVEDMEDDCSDLEKQMQEHPMLNQQLESLNDLRIQEETARGEALELQQRNDASKVQAFVQKWQFAVGAKKHEGLKRQIQAATDERDDLRSKMMAVRQMLPNQADNSSVSSDPDPPQASSTSDARQHATDLHTVEEEPIDLSPTLQDEVQAALDCLPNHVARTSSGDAAETVLVQDS